MFQFMKKAQVEDFNSSNLATVMVEVACYQCKIAQMAIKKRTVFRKNNLCAKNHYKSGKEGPFIKNPTLTEISPKTAFSFQQ